ncbi:hypothetical protein HY504_02515 [Candidatus Wolfebacteria bacterium]|nr:hypothetical protein [Candidatus Wolfebacteria bacterium]
MIREALHNFPAQLVFDPEIKNPGNLSGYKKYIVCGMGGSHLAADLVKIAKPELDIIIHTDYGLPEMRAESLRERLVILSSYSGNTEEVIDSLSSAQEKNLALLVISVGGTLLRLAEERSLPYIQIPDMGIQTRMALGLSVKALLKVMGEEKELEKLIVVSRSMIAEDFEGRGKELALRLHGSIPVIYSSRKNYGIAYNWKIKFNETGKIPAFMNVFPELNHNEMNGFDVVEKTRELSQKFYFIFLRDESDHPRILRRMETLKALYEDRRLKTEVTNLTGEAVWEKIFSSLLMADWAAYYTAEEYRVEAEQVPMVEEFKELIK